jgi:hypothetical protein
VAFCGVPEIMGRCIRSHDSPEPPSAMSALTAARPFTTRESVTRDTPSFFANSVTEISPRTVS